MEPSQKSRDNKPAAAEPLELLAPLEWRHEELEQLRQRVRALMAEGHPRSVASQAAFAELVTGRALERARSEPPYPNSDGGSIDPPEPAA